LWSLFKDRGIGANEEVIVFCVPYFKNKILRLILKSMPMLHLRVYPYGHLEQIYDRNYKPEDTREWFKPIAEYSPKYYR
jgi:hypothetical protein